MNISLRKARSISCVLSIGMPGRLSWRRGGLSQLKAPLLLAIAGILWALVPTPVVVAAATTEPNEQLELGLGPWKVIPAPSREIVYFTNTRNVNDTYFLVGSNGSIVYSADLENWTTTQVPSVAWVTDITSNGTTYVAVCDDGSIHISPDLKTWTTAPSPTKASLNAVSWDGEQFLAVGLAMGLRGSPDGMDWSELSALPPNVTERLNALAFGNNVIVAVGDSRRTADGAFSDTVLMKRDTDEWSVPTHSTTIWLNDVVFGDGKFVAAGDGGQIVFSGDGQDWRIIQTPARSKLNAITRSDAHFVAVGCFGEVTVSVDGIRWEGERIAGGPLLEGICWGQHGWVAVGRQGEVYVRPLFVNSPVPSPQVAQATAMPRLQVVAKSNPPFAYTHGGTWEGYDIELWNAIATETGFTFDIILAQSDDEIIEAMIQAKADVAIGGLTPTLDVTLSVETTYPNQVVGYRALVPEEIRKEWPIVRLLSAVFSREMVGLFAIAFVLSILLAVFMFWSERRASANLFGMDLKSGFPKNLFWSLQTLIAHNCGGDRPRTLTGSSITLLWMVVGVIFTAQVTAILTTDLTISQISGKPITDPGDLQGRKVGTIAASNAQSWLNDHLIKVTGYPNLDSAIDDLLAGKLDTIVYDSILLEYYMMQNPTAPLRITGPFFGLHTHSFFLPNNSPHKDKIDEAVVSLGRRGYLDDLNFRWFGRYFWENNIRTAGGPE